MVGLTRGNEAIVRWETLMPGDQSGIQGRVLVVAALPAGGSATQQQSFLERPDPVTGSWGGASWAFDARGNTYLAWVDQGVVQFSARPSGGAFGSPVAISGPRAQGTVMGVDAAGTVTVGWVASTGPTQTSTERLFLQVRKVTDGALEPVQTVADGRYVHRLAPDGDDDSFETLGDPSIVVSDAGETTLLWERRDARTQAASAHIATRGVSGSFSAPAQIRNCSKPRLLGNGRGDVAVYCREAVAVRPAGAKSFGRLERMSFPARWIDSAVMAPTGAIAVAVSGGGEDFNYSLTSIRPPAGRFAPLRPLEAGEPSSSAYPSLAFEPDGRLTAAFRRFPPGSSWRETSLHVATFAPRYRMAPYVLAEIGNSTLLATRKRGVSIQLSVPERETLTVRLLVDGARARQLHLGRSARTIARARLTMRAFADRDIHIPLVSAARRAIQRIRRLRITLEVSARTPDGRRATHRWNGLLSDRPESAGLD